MASQPQFQQQGIVVRGGPELAHAGFPVGGIAAPDHAERLDAGHHGRRGVEVVDSTPVSGTGEGEGVQPLPSLPSCEHALDGVAGRHHLAAHPVSRKSFLKLFVFWC